MTIVSPFFVDEEVAERRRAHIAFRAHDALSRLANPYDALPWQSQRLKIEMQLAGYVRNVETGCYLTEEGFQAWERAIGGTASVRSDADRRRDLVPYAEVLQEFGSEIANREARPPIEHRRHVDAVVAKMLADVGYDTGSAA